MVQSRDGTSLGDTATAAAGREPGAVDRRLRRQPVVRGVDIRVDFLHGQTASTGALTEAPRVEGQDMKCDADPVWRQTIPHLAIAVALVEQDDPGTGLPGGEVAAL